MGSGGPSIENVILAARQRLEKKVPKEWGLLLFQERSNNFSISNSCNTIQN